jgi:hypothetical protein
MAGRRARRAGLVSSYSNDTAVGFSSAWFTPGLFGVWMCVPRGTGAGGAVRQQYLLAEGGDGGLLGIYRRCGIGQY